MEVNGISWNDHTTYIANSWFEDHDKHAFEECRNEAQRRVDAVPNRDDWPVLWGSTPLESLVYEMGELLHKRMRNHELLERGDVYANIVSLRLKTVDWQQIAGVFLGVDWCLQPLLLPDGDQLLRTIPVLQLPVDIRHLSIEKTLCIPTTIGVRHASGGETIVEDGKVYMDNPAQLICRWLQNEKRTLEQYHADAQRLVSSRPRDEWPLEWGTSALEAVLFETGWLLEERFCQEEWRAGTHFCTQMLWGALRILDWTQIAALALGVEWTPRRIGLLENVQRMAQRMQRKKGGSLHLA